MHRIVKEKKKRVKQDLKNTKKDWKYTQYVRLSLVSFLEECERAGCSTKSLK